MAGEGESGGSGASGIGGLGTLIARSTGSKSGFRYEQRRWSEYAEQLRQQQQAHRAAINAQYIRGSYGALGPPGQTSGQPPPQQQQTNPQLQQLLQLAELVRYFIEAFRKPKAPAAQQIVFPSFDPLVYQLPPPSGGGVGGSMAYNFTPEVLGAGLAGLGATIGNIAAAARGAISSMPGGAIARTAGGALVAGGVGAAINEFLGTGNGCNIGSPFAQSSSTGVRPSIFVVAHPVTGRPVWFRPAGRPILWTGDLSAARRVRKIAGRARRRVGGR